MRALKAELERERAEGRERERQMERYASDLNETFRAERRRADQLRDSYVATVRALTNAVEARDAYTGKHAERVAAYGLELARRISERLAADPQTEFGFLLHDVGKVAIPDVVLHKAGRPDPGRGGADAPPPRDRRGDRLPRGVPDHRGADRAPPPRALRRLAATPTAWPARRSRWRPGSSPWPTRWTP